MNTHDLADRLTRLERENRRLKRIGAVVLLGIVAVVVMGQAKKEKVPAVVKAGRFEVLSKEGHVQAKLGPGLLELLGSGSKDRVRLEATGPTDGISPSGPGDGPTIRLVNDLESRVLIGVRDDNATVEILGGPGEVRAILGMALGTVLPIKKTDPALLFYDRDGEISYEAPPPRKSRCPDED